MSETLYSIAQANMRGATRLLQLLGDDPRDLNICGYHIQQAAELGLKFVLEEQGIDYPKTHSIVELLTKVESTLPMPIFECDLQERLELFAGTLTTWEAQTRYVKDWFVELKAVCTGYRLVAVMLDSIADWSGYGKERFILPSVIEDRLKASRTAVKDLNLGGDNG